MREEVKTFIIYVVIFAAVEVVFYYVFTSNLLSGLHYPESFQAVLFAIRDDIVYFLLGFLAFFAFIVLPKIFSGILVNRLSDASAVLGAVLIVQFLYRSPFVPLEMREFSDLFIITELTILAFGTVYYISKDYNQKFLPAIIRGSACIVAALLMWEIIAGLSFEYNTHIATAVGVGLTFAGVTILFYPLRLSKNQIFRKLGLWFSSSTSKKFLLGFFLALYLSLLRPYLFDHNSEYLILGEWVLIGLVSGGLSLWVRSNLKPAGSEEVFSNWVIKENAPKKHKQMIIAKTTEEMKTLKEYVNDFVKNGLKTDILLFIIRSSFENGLPYYKLHNVLEDFISYKDLPMPRFNFLKEADFVKKENLENRRKVLGMTIERMNEAYRGW